MKKNFYITTPIYYVNDEPHIGHAYTTIVADVLNRYQKLLGNKSFFLTGTDEHGQKVQEAAKKRKIPAHKQAEECHYRFKKLWEELGIQYDRFIRTTEPGHISFVQQQLQKLYEGGEIYPSTYKAWYSVGEERFFSDEELVDAKDPISKKPVEWLEEKNYFFQMSKYQTRLIKHIEQNPDFILPSFRRNEVLAFLKKPLRDLCVSRPKSRLSWGISLPFDRDFVTYVWFDALLNYQSAVEGLRFPNQSPIWPADCHLIGKDILTTHAIYWPTMLMALGQTLPRHIFAHGWWLSGGQKLSKSSGNSVAPLSYLEKYGRDAMRYFLLRNMNLGQDALVTEELFSKRINTDLANDLGNAINRIHKLMTLYFSANIPVPQASAGVEEKELYDKALPLCDKPRIAAMLDRFQLSLLLEEIAELVRCTNRYLEKKAPWHLAKEDGQSAKGSALSTTLYYSAEALRLALSLLSPVMPQKTLAGLQMLGVKEKPSLKSLSWGFLQGGESIAHGEALFPRIKKT